MVRINKGKDGEDPATRAVRICLQLFTNVNKVFLLFTNILKVLILPQLSRYQYRVYITFALQVFTSDGALLILGKSLQTFFSMNNLLLLASIGSCLPFFRTAYQLWVYIPCPPMPSVISNLALVVSFVTLMVLGLGTYNGNTWVVYTYVFMIWPWLTLTSMVSRLFIDRQASKSPFSPLRELPVLGFISGIAEVLSFVALKTLTVTDCIVLIGMDHVLAAACASAVLGPLRRERHFHAMKAYAIMMTIVALYSIGHVPDQESLNAIFTSDRALFLASRLLVAMRSVFVKWQYGNYYRCREPNKPPENGLLFYSNDKPKIHRFMGFPSPMLLTLDCIFDSGLRDMELHGMGPHGTVDLHMMTESSYTLPIASLAAWLMESDTLPLGLMPQLDSGSQTALDIASTALATAIAEGSATVTSSESSVPIVTETSTGSTGTYYCLGIAVVYCLCRLLRPIAIARSLFDRSSPHQVWKYQPILAIAPVFCFDVLFLNSFIDKYQVIMVILLAAINAVYRADAWNAFKRKYLLLMTQDLNYQQPSALRQLQRRTLIEVLSRNSEDDFANMLMDTAISHGNNIRELARDMSIKVWDPSPSATAAWKLAFSLVTKSLRRQKLLRKKKNTTKQEVIKFIEDLVHEMVFKAVDQAAGNGARMRIASSMAAVTAKRRAIRRLRELAIARRTLRAKRRAGQLALAPAQVAYASGNLRSQTDIRNTIGPMKSMLALPPMPALGMTTQSPFMPKGVLPMSLTAGSFNAEPDGDMSPASQALFRTSMPGEVTASLDFFPDLETGTSFTKSSFVKVKEEPKRGVWREAFSMTGSPASGSLIVLALGDAKRGQLGVEPGQGLRTIARCCFLTVEELRNQQPVQILASGVASFVVGEGGQIWAFGSNRSMELGCRKEVAQVSCPQRIKSVRAVQVVQVASSTSASGQAHTLVLGHNGEVHTFGTSSTGALGQGPDVKVTGPLLLRLSSQVPIKQVACGARHSILLSDTGKLFAMGDNGYGQLGVEAEGRRTTSSTDVPTAVRGPLESDEVRVKLLSVGDNHCLAVTEDGRMFSWGANANGQLGLGRLSDQATPQLVKELQGFGVAALACGARHSLAVTHDGSKIWAWGSNVQGQLGIGPNNSGEGYQRTLPSLIAALSNKKGFKVAQITAAAAHSLVATMVGEVFGFGDNTSGQLGFPTITAKDNLCPPNQLPLTQHQQVQRQSRDKQMEDVRKANELDVPRAFGDGVETLWLPARVVSLSQYRIRSICTGELHTLALAQLD